ncbi:16928_t:CDS:1, partial [Funneliformis mosseae]
MINLFFRLKIFNQSTRKIPDDEIDIKIEEGYDEFIKEYRSRYEWDNKENSGFIS